MILAADPNAGLSCNISETISCAKVGITWQANLLGFPNAFLGLIAEPVVITIAVAGLGGVRFPRWFMNSAMAVYAIGLGFAYWLFFQAYFVIGALCPWCLLITVTTTTVFASLLRVNLSDNTFGLSPRAYERARYLLRIGVDIWATVLIITVLAGVGLLAVRVAQERAVRPVGATAETPIDVRLLSATHKDLAAEVAAGRFRQDLYYRLNVIELRVPPLRERREDIGLLTERMLARLAQGSGLPCAKLSSEALDKLKSYRFPGNVRELENMLERAYTLCEDDRITTSDLRLADSVPISENGEANLAQIDNLEDYLEAIERKLIMQALEETRWNRTAAAQRLGLSFRSMRYRLKKLGID